VSRPLTTVFASVLGAAIATSAVATPATAAGMYRISQESAPGVGDFDSNVLGFLDSFKTTGTIASFYQYSNGFAASFNGPVSLSSNASHLFLVDGSDGLGLFSVYDKPADIGGGIAHMQFDLVGDTAGFLALDDPSEGYYTSNGSTFTTQNAWAPCCTDGFAIGSLDNDWTMFAQFSKLGSLSGGQLTSWKALSDDGSSVSLALETNRKIRIDRVPEPATIVGLLAVAVGGSMTKRRDSI